MTDTSINVQEIEVRAAAEHALLVKKLDQQPPLLDRQIILELLAEVGVLRLRALIAEQALSRMVALDSIEQESTEALRERLKLLEEGLKDNGCEIVKDAEGKLWVRNMRAGEAEYRVRLNPRQE